MGRISTSSIPKITGAPGVERVAATATVYGHSFRLGDGSDFAASLRASGTGTPDIDVYFEQTHVDPESVTSSEGVVGDATNGWVQAQGASKVMDIVTNGWYDFVITPISLPFGRFKYIGQGANPADCDVQQNISQKEDAN